MRQHHQLVLIRIFAINEQRISLNPQPNYTITNAQNGLCFVTLFQGSAFQLIIFGNDVAIQFLRSELAVFYQNLLFAVTIQSQ